MLHGSLNVGHMLYVVGASEESVMVPVCKMPNGYSRISVASQRTGMIYSADLSWHYSNNPKHEAWVFVQAGIKDDLRIILMTESVHIVGGIDHTTIAFNVNEAHIKNRAYRAFCKVLG